MAVKTENFFLAFSIILSAVEVMSDVLLTVSYCLDGNKVWCMITGALNVVPSLLGILGFPCLFDTWLQEGWGAINDDIESRNELKETKGLQACIQSAPQLLIQLYIMALTEKDNTSLSGNTSFHF